MFGKMQPDRKKANSNKHGRIHRTVETFCFNEDDVLNYFDLLKYVKYLLKYVKYLTY